MFIPNKCYGWPHLAHQQHLHHQEQNNPSLDSPTGILVQPPQPVSKIPIRVHAVMKVYSGRGGKPLDINHV